MTHALSQELHCEMTSHKPVRMNSSPRSRIPITVIFGGDGLKNQSPVRKPWARTLLLCWDTLFCARFKLIGADFLCDPLRDTKCIRLGISIAVIGAIKTDCKGLELSFYVDRLSPPSVMIVSLIQTLGTCFACMRYCRSGNKKYCKNDRCSPEQ